MRKILINIFCVFLFKKELRRKFRIWGSYAFKAKPRRARNGKVYDCFIFFNELELLDIRLNTLDPAVDFFVIVEANKTFTGKEKNYVFEKNADKFKRFSHKIIHVKVSDLPDDKDPWHSEFFQRAAIERGLDGANDEDVIIVSDLDEIPNPKMIAKYRDTKGVKVFYQKMYYYYLNYLCVSNPIWIKGSRMCRLDELRYKGEAGNYKYVPEEYMGTPQNLRFRTGFPIKDGGWHFSFIGGYDAIIKKIEAYSEQQFNKPQYTNKEYVLETIMSGKDLFGRENMVYQPVDIDDSYPNYISSNTDKFRHLII